MDEKTYQTQDSDRQNQQQQDFNRQNQFQQNQFQQNQFQQNQSQQNQSQQNHFQQNTSYSQVPPGHFEQSNVSPFIIDGTYTEQPQYHQKQTTYGSYAFASQSRRQQQVHSSASGSTRKKKKSSPAARITLFTAKACVFGLLAGATMFATYRGVDYLWPRQRTVDGKTQSAVTAGTTVLHDESSDTTAASSVAAVSQSAMASLVSITNNATVEQQTLIGPIRQEAVSSGTGIIVGENDDELLVATNYHVISGSQSLDVTFINEKTAKAELKGGDEEMDLAVIAIAKNSLEDDTLSAIKIATLGSSGHAQVGEQVVAIGNALGYGQSVTTGIISAFRTMSFADSSSLAQQDSRSAEKQWIQTDAAINPGNSGGALMNMNGEVIGINTVKVKNEAVESMGYAIPIDEAMPILQDLMNRTTRTKVAEADQGFLGIAGMGVNADAQQMYGIPAGVYITRVQEGAAAEAAGLREGDIIVKVGDNKVGSMTDLKQELTYYRAGEQLKLQIRRNSNSSYKEKTIEVTLSAESEIR